MKYLFIAIPFLAFTSCGGGACDNSTPEGAADCACGYMDELKAIGETQDQAKLEEIEPKIKAWEGEVEKNIDAGKYTENDLEAALKAKNCNM